MDSRINLGEGIHIPQDKEFKYVNSWVPITPEKPILTTRSNSMPMERHGSQLGRGNLQELAGFPSGYIQQVSDYSRAAQHLGQFGSNGNLVQRNRMINQIAGSYTQALRSESANWDASCSLTDLLAAAAPLPGANRSLNRSMSMTAERPFIPNLHSHFNSSSQTKYVNQTHCSSSNMFTGHNSLYQMPQYGFPIPCNKNYDLNSVQSTEAYASSSVHNSFQLEPVTPEQTNKLRNQLCTTVNFPQEKSTSEERLGQHDLVVSIDGFPNEKNSNELLHNIGDSFSAVISAPFEEPKDCSKGSDQVIDLNQTPQQKPPKRRKHRPKVVVEGKPTRTPKAATRKIADPKKTASEKRKYVRKKTQHESANQQPDSIGETTDPMEKPKEKRKYVRKKSLREPESQNADCIGKATYPSSKTAAPSCRRALNFDSSESTREERENNSIAQQVIENKEKETYNLRTDFQVAESICRTKSELQNSQQSELLLKNRQSRATSNFTPMNELPNNDITISTRRDPGPSYISISDSIGAAIQLASTEGVQMNNIYADVRDKDIRTQQHIRASGIFQVASPSRINCRSLENSRQMMPQNTPLSTSEISPHSTEGRGSKRGYCHVEQTSHCTANTPCKLLRQEMPRTDYCQYNHMSSAVYSETRKKKKIENRIYTNTNSLPASVAAINHSRSTMSSNDVPSIASTSQRNSEILNSHFGSNYMKGKENNGSKAAVDWYRHLMASRLDLSMQNLLTGQNSCTERVEESNKSTKVQGLSSLASIENYNMPPLTPPKTAPQRNVDVSRKQEVGPNQSISVASGKCKMLQEQADILKGLQSPARRKGRPAKQKFPATIEEIIYRMERLSLNEKMKGKEQNALVLYKGDGTLVPYQGFEFIKKRKPRPKVDLDPETERVWKLLMWKEGSEGLEETDEDKQRWWDEERRVFRGRADSFIARMHLVQGDRRFSKWKGSVVDSVIGVFLTQNVSDHLSSSAFMSLAAKFPLKSTRNRNHKRDGTRILVEEPDVSTSNPNGTIKWHENSSCNHLYNQISIALYESKEHQRECMTSWTERTSIVEAHSHSPEEEALSSQDSFDSSVVQNNGVRSYSGSNSEAEDPANGCKHSKNLRTSSTNSPQVENTTLFEEFYSHVSGRSLFHEASKHGHKQPEATENRHDWPRLERLDYSIKGTSSVNQQLNYNNPHMQIPVVPPSNYPLYSTAQSEMLEVESLELCGEESISSWPSSASRISKEKYASNTSKKVAQGAENAAKPTAQHYSSAMHQETPIVDPHAFLSKQMMCEQGNPGPCDGSQPHEVNKTFQSDSQSIAKPAYLAASQSNRQSSYNQPVSNAPELTGKVFDVEERITLADKQGHSEKKIVESNLEQVHFTSKVNSSINSLKTRKEKAQSQKKDAVDWDNLRKQALANGERKERSQDTMDSLDYEALRCASVNQIADAIKERGMNNMLAERIQEFLNRLVREHGSIDLEWLRDVPPDKAKDYLLSMRGLGLKSVECVRLLTLHHLAFPVDTNVGRIAVRLGWVPLQPLPESLQLHLLEMYPILESIQKYLWPRLCKLDQRTLYELHYQMITFGKVFCTKSKPNCNACPMRAECRHFASAFASARLALPGPEEKSIVTSTVPIATERSPGIVIDPMPLPPPEENSLKRGEPDIVSCVPIIEEPATPEQEHTEVIESDIEDIFYEDPDEIPTINLNLEELAVNVQNYMQANMELQECDMSKALVALNPEAASIPTPKLKNISQLRTEHQVYELPDSHPLLKGMDKRERDDPSPYLLAIWTPGETANSIQPPDTHCQSQESNKLCNDETCFSCNSVREANSQTVRGTLLIPCRTAMRGSFPLNGTYFQVNEVFADHESSLNPINVPRAWIWNLPRRLVYFGTSVSTIFKDNYFY
ncbi:transcriptional activator DEMETER isoform X2 [Jatropha curcas]|uniref:transcriptional activator DEMETER isoform X2 n=1 Tax=Jatropha curcas TaxID=180498 RepID=UPI0005FAFC7E|nr:transcriptional activator DEMETER isoform X2 [Jatropha curcas]